MVDRAGLTQACAGHDAVVNLVTALPATRQFPRRRAWRANDHVRIDGSAAVVDAALAAGVERLVQESVTMLYRDRGSAWVDEDVQVESYSFARANLAAEANAKRFTDSGRAGVVLRFGWFPGAAHSEQFLALARGHVCVAIGRADSYVSSIHPSDAAGAVVAALHAPAGPHNVVDDEPLTTHDDAGALAAAAGTTTWLRLPSRAALLLGDRTTSLTRSLRVSNARLKAATGWSPRFRSAREGWTATAAALAHRPLSPQQAAT
jgi:nucleoside-diphosphate-sugar epimerase